MSRFWSKASDPLKVIGRLASVGALTFGVYSTGLAIYVANRHTNGTSRVYDPPIWESAQKSDIISRRYHIIEGLRDLYQMKPGAAKDPEIMGIFRRDCEFEDPYQRLVGPSEISRAFDNLYRRNKYIKFTTYQPTHYEDMILIKCERQYELKNALVPNGADPTQTCLSNLAVHLKKSEDGEEKVFYIAEEWNYVSLLQPDTHNAFLFAGSLAKSYRRLSSIFTQSYLEENKYFFNPLRVFTALNNAPDALRRYVHDILTDKEKVEAPPKQPATSTSTENVFNAGVRRN